MSYFDELVRAMTWLGQKPDTIFLGQSVAYPGNALYKTLSGVPQGKRIEMPVAEDMQMGISIGLNLGGKIPISIYPRMNFLMCAMNQLVNHLDKIAEYSNGQFIPKVIVRVGVGSESPLDPGIQHKGDYPLYFENIEIKRLCNTDDVFPSYQEAYYNMHSTLLIEYADSYHAPFKFEKEGTQIIHNDSSQSKQSHKDDFGDDYVEEGKVGRFEYVERWLKKDAKRGEQRLKDCREGRHTWGHSHTSPYSSKQIWKPDVCARCGARR